VPLRACHNQPVLPDDLFGPLDLDEALDHAEDAGEDAVIALLREALTDPRAHGDEQLADYLDPLVEAYRSAGRQREAIDTLRQIADREPNLRGYLTALIADLHAQLGEQDTALNLIKTWQATQRALAADQRDIDFYAPTALTAAEQAGDLELARSLIADGLRLAAERGDAPVQELMLTAVEMRLFPEKAAEARHTMASRGPDPAARRHPATTQHRPQPAVGRAAYLPAAEYAAAWEQKLLDATTHRAHEDYRRELEQTLRAIEAFGSICRAGHPTGVLVRTRGSESPPAVAELDHALARSAPATAASPNSARMAGKRRQTRGRLA